MRAEIRVAGVVQGVGFRPFIYRVATANSLKGYVRNCGDAGVEIVVEGKRSDLDGFLEALRRNKPPLASIYEVKTHFTQETEKYKTFEIFESLKKRKVSGSTIPPDIAICDECLKELRDPDNPRHNYFFITCTNCGPRFTTIQGLPYDRENTTMKEFEMCSQCRGEYSNPSNRRFHAQTVACPQCGPKVHLSKSDGKPLVCSDPIREAGRLLEAGYILAVKGFGGFHLAASATKDEPALRLRRVKHRSQKPFAIMARDLQAVRTFAEVSEEEETVLSSYTRPIVLLDKAEGYHLSNLVAPGLHNVGVMLPYTALHLMLFDDIEEPAFIMTSANPSSEPIVTDDEEALKKLGSTVDYFLFHNREIAERCDDSVVRLHGDKMSFVRRSRGYAPAPINLKLKFNRCTLGVGAEENVTTCILMGDKAFISQYIGDVENLETYKFLQDTVHKMAMLTNAKVEAVACDLHPKFASARMAEKISEEEGWDLVKVQHHHSHITSLMGEHGLTEMIGIACDGYGYGIDGKAWGGEILSCDDNGFKRLKHLQEQPLVGGDLASRYPLRMAAGILIGTVNIEDWLLTKSRYFPHGDDEVNTVLTMAARKDAFQTTTSCGRVLDAISAILGICHERTYQGEPAMKIESVAECGYDVLKLKPQIERSCLQTSNIVATVYGMREKHSLGDLASSAQSYLARGLADLAVEAAQETGISEIGFSGGVAYNRKITSILRKSVEESGFRFYVHETLPAGDGGISFGQAVRVAAQGD